MGDFLSDHVPAELGMQRAEHMGRVESKTMSCNNLRRWSR